MKKDRVKNGTDFTEMAETLRAVAHPERLAIIHLLWTGGCLPMSVKSIYETLHLEQSVASKHLGLLKRCGLMKKERTGRATCYRLNLDNAVVSAMAHCLEKTHD